MQCADPPLAPASSSSSSLVPSDIPPPTPDDPVGLRRFLTPESLSYLRECSRRTKRRSPTVAAALAAPPATTRHTPPPRPHVPAASDVKITTRTVAPVLVQAYRAETQRLDVDLEEVARELREVGGELERGLGEREKAARRQEELDGMKGEWDSRVSSEGSRQGRQEHNLAQELADVQHERGAVEEEVVGEEAERVEREEALTRARQEAHETEVGLEMSTRAIEEMRSETAKAEELGVLERKEMDRTVEALRRQNEELRHEIEKSNVLQEQQSDKLATSEQQLAKLRADISGLGRQVYKQRANSAAERNQLLMRGAAPDAAAGPTGMVTVVFLDAQDSQAIWEELPDCMTIAQATASKIVRDKVVRNSGYEVKSDGESFMIAFTSARSAVSFAVDVQEAFVHAEWPPKLLQHPGATEVVLPDGTVLFKGLRMRIGMHTGTPQCTFNPSSKRMDYQGPMVNKAARVASLAGGGCILTSEEAYRAFREQIDPKKILTRPLPQKVVLRGFTTEDTLYEVVPGALQARMSGPASSGTPGQRAVTTDEGGERNFGRLRNLNREPGAEEEEEGGAEAGEDIKRMTAKLSQREQMLDASRKEYSAVHIEIEGLRKKMEELERDRSEVKAHLKKEDVSRHKYQLNAAKSAQERIEKDVVLDKARDNIKSIVNHQTSIAETLSVALTEKDDTKSGYASMDEKVAQLLMRDESSSQQEALNSLRSRCKELEERVLASKIERQHQLDRVAKLQQRLEAEEERNRKREAESKDRQRRERVEEAERRAREFRDKINQLELLENTGGIVGGTIAGAIAIASLPPLPKVVVELMGATAATAVPVAPQGDDDAVLTPELQELVKREIGNVLSAPITEAEIAAVASGGDPHSSLPSDASALGDGPDGLSEVKVAELELEFVRKRAQLRNMEIEQALQETKRAKEEFQENIKLLEKQIAVPGGGAASEDREPLGTERTGEVLGEEVTERDCAASTLAETQHRYDGVMGRKHQDIRRMTIHNTHKIRELSEKSKKLSAAFTGILENPANAASSNLITTIQQTFSSDGTGSAQEQPDAPVAAQAETAVAPVAGGAGGAGSPGQPSGLVISVTGDADGAVVKDQVVSAAAKKATGAQDGSQTPKAMAAARAAARKKKAEAVAAHKATPKHAKGAAPAVAAAGSSSSPVAGAPAAPSAATESATEEAVKAQGGQEEAAAEETESDSESEDEDAGFLDQDEDLRYALLGHAKEEDVQAAEQFERPDSVLAGSADVVEDGDLRVEARTFREQELIRLRGLYSSRGDPNREHTPAARRQQQKELWSHEASSGDAAAAASLHVGSLSPEAAGGGRGQGSMPSSRRSLRSAGGVTETVFAPPPVTGIGLGLGFDAILKVQSILSERNKIRPPSRDPTAGGRERSPSWSLLGGGGSLQLEALGKMLSGQWVSNRELISLGLPPEVIYENEYESNIVRQRKLRAERQSVLMSALRTATTSAGVAGGPQGGRGSRGNSRKGARPPRLRMTMGSRGGARGYLEAPGSQMVLLSPSSRPSQHGTFFKRMSLGTAIAHQRRGSNDPTSLLLIGTQQRASSNNLVGPTNSARLMAVSRRARTLLGSGTTGDSSDLFSLAVVGKKVNN